MRSSIPANLAEWDSPADRPPARQSGNREPRGAARPMAVGDFGPVFEDGLGLAASRLWAAQYQEERRLLGSIFADPVRLMRVAGEERIGVPAFSGVDHRCIFLSALFALGRGTFTGRPLDDQRAIRPFVVQALKLASAWRPDAPAGSSLSLWGEATIDLQLFGAFPPLPAAVRLHARRVRDLAARLAAARAHLLRAQELLRVL